MNHPTLNRHAFIIVLAVVGAIAFSALGALWQPPNEPARADAQMFEAGMWQLTLNRAGRFDLIVLEPQIVVWDLTDAQTRQVRAARRIWLAPLNDASNGRVYRRALK